MTLPAFLAAHNLTDQAPQLAAYAALIRQWNPKINLVSPATLPDLETRHLLDSAQLVPHLPETSAEILDVGSGAGLPGLVLAMLCPQHRFTLAERDQRKAAFLSTVRHELGLAHVTVHAGDVVELEKRAKRFDIVTGRAFTATARFIDMTQSLLLPDGCWLLLKGQAVSQELEGCPPMTITRTPSITDATGWVVRMRPAHS